MSRRQRGAWGPLRRGLFALVPAILAALLMLAADRPSTGTSRLHAADTTRLLRPTGVPVTTTTTLAPAGEEPADGDVTTTAVGDGAGPGDEDSPAPAIAPTPAPGGSVGAETGLTAAGRGTTAGTGTTTPAASTVSAGPARGPATTVGRAGPAAAAAPVAPAETTTTTTTAPTTTTTAPPASGSRRNPAVEGEIVTLTNRDRSRQGLGSLARDGCLDGVASRYAKHLAASGVLAHNPRAGDAIDDCRPNATWGDNVGTTTPCSAAFLEEQWMASASHRRNIMTGAFTRVGVGVWTDGSGACWAQVLFSS